MINLKKLTDAQLAQLRTSLRNEMRVRGLADSVGAIGEQLAIDYFQRTPGLPNLQLAPRGTKNVDALSRAGDRYSIKTVCDAKKTGTIYPEMADQNKQLFEHLLIVRLAEDWSLRSIHELSWDQFVGVRAWDKRMNAWYVPVSKRTFLAGRVVLALA